MNIIDLMILIPQTSRVQKLKKFLKDRCGVEDHMINSGAGKGIFAVYEEYISLEKESCKHYDNLKKIFSLAFGEDTFETVRDYTRYFVQTQYMRRKNLRDSVTDRRHFFQYQSY